MVSPLGSNLKIEKGKHLLATENTEFTGIKSFLRVLCDSVVKILR
jgi:hypothetical protein